MHEHLYDAVAEGAILTIALKKGFGMGNLARDWATSITKRWPGPFKQVRVDLSHCGTLNSTALAGLIQFYHAYTEKGAGPVVLDRPDSRVLRTMRVMCMENLFEVRPREE